LLRVGGSRESIAEQLIREHEVMFREDAQNRVLRMEELLKESSAKEAKNYLTEAISRFSASLNDDNLSGTITVQKDEVKGSIVGRGGQNIGLFEELYGVDVVFNDEPNIISLSCFNLVQREIAKQALILLMQFKIITPDKIRMVKEQAEKKVSHMLTMTGEKAAKVLGLTNVDPELIKLIGRLQFRTSYGQNALEHCVEVGYFSRMLAAEIGADENIAFQGGFFHDIGKAIDQEVGGSHDVLTKEILEKYGFSWEITHAAWTHHDAIPQETVEAMLVKAADAISASRPGARALSLEQYIQKIRELENTAQSFEGVKKAFAISAGREVRVVVNPDGVSDEHIQELAEQIAHKVEEKGGYPGKIKITTIRTTKVVDYAK
ncbi:MAG: HD domain-containing protein, partial [Patescibacteria group bacterium]